MFSSDAMPLMTRLGLGKETAGQRLVVAMEKWERGWSHHMEASDVIWKSQRERMEICPCSVCP